MKFLEHDIQDKNFLRYIKRFLIAGIMEGTELLDSDRGTPQGGLISPVLANVYLHYVLDLWFETAIKPKLMGREIRPVAETMKKIAAIIRGHCNYYGVNGNLHSLYKFHDYMRYATRKMLNRRSQRGYVTYEKFQRIWGYHIAPPRITKDVWCWTPKTV